MRNRNLGKGVILILLICIIVVATSIIIAMSLQTDEVGDIIKNDQLIKVLFVLHDDEKSCGLTFSFIILFRGEARSLISPATRAQYTKVSTEPTA